jgi:hypothetical protein
MKTAVDEFLQWQAAQLPKSSSQFFFTTQNITGTLSQSSYIQQATNDCNIDIDNNALDDNLPFAGVYTRSQGKPDTRRRIALMTQMLQDNQDTSTLCSATTLHPPY